MKHGNHINPSLIGIAGATSLVGSCLLKQLEESKQRAIAFSRKESLEEENGQYINWRKITYKNQNNSNESIPFWLWIAPIWTLPSYFHLLEAYNAKRIIVISSTSIYTKNKSTSNEEKETIQLLTNSEKLLKTWAESNNIEWVILRPTLIYGLGKDKNIAEITKFIKRFGFFPLFGEAQGLRQPIHANDVALASYKALQVAPANKAYNIAGASTLTYTEMVNHIYHSLNKRKKSVHIPLFIFKMALTLMRRAPRFDKWTIDMATRMNQDMVFDYKQACQDFGFSPKRFKLLPEDLP